METNIEGPSGSIHVSSEETVIKGPSGEIRVSNGVKSGDTLTQTMADKIVAQAGDQFSLSKEGEDTYLIGPDGFKVKIGDKLSEENIKALTQYVPDLIKGSNGNKKDGPEKTPSPIPGDAKTPQGGKTPTDSSQSPPPPAPAPSTPK